MGFIRGSQIEIELKMDSKTEIRIDQGQLNWNVIARGAVKLVCNCSGAVKLERN